MNISFPEAETAFLAKRGWNYASIETLEQSLADAGWERIQITPLLGGFYRIQCERFSPLASERYVVIREKLNSLHIEIDAFQERLVYAFQEQYRWAVSEMIDERWTRPPYIPAWVAEFLPRPDPPPLSPWCDPKAREP